MCIRLKAWLILALAAVLVAWGNGTVAADEVSTDYFAGTVSQQKDGQWILHRCDLAGNTYRLKFVDENDRRSILIRLFLAHGEGTATYNTGNHYGSI